MNNAVGRQASNNEGSSGSRGSSMSLLDRVRMHDPAAWRELVELYGPLIGYWCRKAGLQPADVADVTQAVFMAVSRRLPDFRNTHSAYAVNHNSTASKATPDPTPNSPGRSGLFRSWLFVVTRRKLIDWRRATRPDQAQGGSSAARRLQDQVDPFAPSSPSSLDSEFPAVSSPSMNATSIDSSTTNSWEAECRADGELSRVWNGVVSRGLEQIRPEFQSHTWEAFWRTVVDGQATAIVATELNLSLASVRQAKSRILRRLRQQLGDL
ncbi:MAG: sigma-70 family RNA polymerase sigma factor [Pirellulaceae bacterium]|nr:sigma-70 family RNA polymerase sigma factor [Pirellulaceae bacterium]